jgi:hypothetical protein
MPEGQDLDRLIDLIGAAIGEIVKWLLRLWWVR